MTESGLFGWLVLMFGGVWLVIGVLAWAVFFRDEYYNWRDDE